MGNLRFSLEVNLRAMTDFPDFEWARLMTLVAGDFQHLTAAIAAVDGNVYFGYNDQMAAASAKLFSSLGHAAFQLCIRAGGDNPLKDYAGKPRVAPGKPQIDQLVEDYVTRRANAAAPPQAIMDVAETVRLAAVAVVAHGRLIGN